MINKIFSFLFARTNISYFRKKTLIVNFKKDITKSIKIIDLTQYKNYYFSTKKETQVADYINNYKLLLIDNSDSDNVKETILAYFETLKEAQNAQNELNNKMYDRFLTVVYNLLKVFLTIFIILLLSDMFKASFINNNTVASNQVPAITEETLKRLQQMQQAQQIPQSTNANNANSNSKSQQDTNKEQINIDLGSSEASGFLR